MSVLEDVATRAVRLNEKPTKKEAHRAISYLVTRGLVNAEYDEVAQLYAYFLPPVPKQPITPEEWVAKVINPKDQREHLRYLYSDGLYLIASNGHVLHRIPTKLPSGFYDQALTRIDLNITYPQYERLLITHGDPVNIVIDDLQITERMEHTCYILPNGRFLDKPQLDLARKGLSEFRLDWNRDAAQINHPDGSLALLAAVR